MSEASPLVSQPSVAVSKARACAKLILFGEHFVVHGSPALAMPLTSLSTSISICRQPGNYGPSLVTSAAPKVSTMGQRMLLAALDNLEILRELADWQVTAQSTIPVGHGLGSSAAFSVAVVRAFGQAAGLELSAEDVNKQAYSLEELVHGTPSGIDNTVITFEQPIWFVKGEEVEHLPMPSPPNLVLASSGYPGSTLQAVGTVRAKKETSPDHFDELCGEADELIHQGREAFLDGNEAKLGELMLRNHRLLQALGVSTRALDRLVTAACRAGAYGAKLTGAGRGGFAVAAVSRERRSEVVQALLSAGATMTLCTGQDQ